MRELSLFSGIGGGLIASRILGWNTVCAVEINSFCRQILHCRQNDKLLEHFPIYKDIHEFDGHLWKDRVDIVSGGFPCQSFSHAARGRNTAPDLWPEMLRIVKEIQPPYVFAENVQDKPISRAASHLYELGYSCRYMCLSAADLGAPTIRKRYWLAAYANPDGDHDAPSMLKHPGHQRYRLWNSGKTTPEQWEFMMGFPRGWTDPVCNLSAMPKFPQSQSQPGTFSRAGFDDSGN